MDDYCQIHWFAERDIDLWLAEELRVNSAFARWLLDRAGLPNNVLVPANRTRVSVSADNRETDVEAIFQSADGSQVAVFIENKIKANFQLNQMEDYVKRGEAGKSAGKWKDFAVIVFAPLYRMFSLPANVIRVHFEDAVQFLEQQRSDNVRTSYRAQFLKRAAERQIIVAENIDQAIVEWWQAANAMVRREFGDVFSPVAPCKTTYIAPRFLDQPPYLRLEIKGSQGEVALVFRDFSEPALRTIIENELDDIAVVRKPQWKDPVLQVGDLDGFEISDGIEVIETRVKSAYNAANRLINFWKTNKTVFDNAAAIKATSHTN